MTRHVRVSELSKGQLQVRTLARRKAGLPQVLVLQPRNTRTHAHNPFLRWGGGKCSQSQSQSRSSAARSRDDSGQQFGMACVCFLHEILILANIQKSQISVSEAFPT